MSLQAVGTSKKHFSQFESNWQIKEAPFKEIAAIYMF